MNSPAMPTLLSVMTPFPYSIDSRAPLPQAAALMHRHGIHHLAVTDCGALETLVSARDIDRSHLPGHPLDPDLRVGDVCPPRAYMADVGDPLDRILDAMAATHIGAVLVTRDGELAGIFTLQDACRLLAGQLRERYPATHR